MRAGLELLLHASTLTIALQCPLKHLSKKIRPQTESPEALAAPQCSRYCRRIRQNTGLRSSVKASILYATSKIQIMKAEAFLLNLPQAVSKEFSNSFTLLHVNYQPSFRSYPELRCSHVLPQKKFKQSYHATWPSYETAMTREGSP